MELQRRSFLKGMGAVSGVAAAGVSFDCSNSLNLGERRAWYKIAHLSGCVQTHLTRL